VALVGAGLDSVGTYDVSVPGKATGRLSLVDSGQRPETEPQPVDVFDWESHSWRRLGIDQGLRPSEYSSGIVRARLQSPEAIFQLVVDTTGAPG